MLECLDWKQLGQLEKTTFKRCASNTLAFFPFPIKWADGHGRVRPCAKEKLFPKSCFQKSEGSTMNYLRNAQMRITCGKFLMSDRVQCGIVKYLI